MHDYSHTPFSQILDALLDPDQVINPQYLYRLSDLNPEELDQLTSIWNRVPDWRREAIMQDAEQLGVDDTLLSFEGLACLGVQDSNAAVRLAAVRTLWEYEDKNFIPLFLSLMETDRNDDVRAAAASALGAYVYLGELEEIPHTLLRKIEDHLLQIYQGSEPETIRRCALESLGYSSRPDVIPLIEAEFRSSQKEWIASALFAMGRSGNVLWFSHVLSMLDSQFPVLRAEAARAAGELEIASASTRLIELLDDPDDDTRLASIWALSQIGGEGVRAALERILDESDDEEEQAYIESALDNLQFNEDLQLLPLFDYTDLEESPLPKIGGNKNEYDPDEIVSLIDDEFDGFFGDLDDELEDEFDDDMDWDERYEDEDDDEDYAEDHQA